MHSSPVTRARFLTAAPALIKTAARGTNADVARQRGFAPYAAVPSHCHHKMPRRAAAE